MSSSPNQKFLNDKMSKKNYHKFKGNQEKDRLNEKPSSPLLKNEAAEKNSRFVSSRDFPDLKVSRGTNKKYFFENNVNRFKTDITNEKPDAAFVNAENIKKNENGSGSIKDTIKLQPISGSDASVESKERGAEKQLNANHKDNKTAIKKTPVQPERNPNKKKRSEPVFINFQDMLAKKIQKKAEKRQPKILRNRVQRQRNKELLSGNFLDSSNPKRNRGKHRERKKERLSNLKLTIIKERILKSKIREMIVTDNFVSGSVNSTDKIDFCSINLLDKIDFNAEIKSYLNVLSEKKLKQLENKKAKINENINVEKINKDKEESAILKAVLKNEENCDSGPCAKEKIIPWTAAEGEIKFSSKFREYCNNIITPHLNSAVEKLIEELIKLQDRMFLRDPVRAKTRKRHVSGIREVRKYLVLKKVKMILIAPNLEKLHMEGSVYDSINELKSMAESQNVPYGFVLDRFKLGRCTKKYVPVSAFAILNYEGLEALYENVLHQLLEAKNKFSEMAKPKTTENTEDVNSKVLSTLLSAFEETLQVSKETSDVVEENKALRKWGQDPSDVKTTHSPLMQTDWQRDAEISEGAPMAMCRDFLKIQHMEYGRQVSS